MLSRVSLQPGICRIKSTYMITVSENKHKWARGWSPTRDTRGGEGDGDWLVVRLVDGLGSRSGGSDLGANFILTLQLCMYFCFNL